MTAHDKRPSVTRKNLKRTGDEARPMPCGRVVADGHEVYDDTCGACHEMNSDAPDWTLR